MNTYNKPGPTDTPDPPTHRLEAIYIHMYILEHNLGLSYFSLQLFICTLLYITTCTLYCTEIDFIPFLMELSTFSMVIMCLQNQATLPHKNDEVSFSTNEPNDELILVLP